MFPQGSPTTVRKTSSRRPRVSAARRSRSPVRMPARRRTRSGIRRWPVLVQMQFSLDRVGDGEGTGYRVDTEALFGAPTQRVEQRLVDHAPRSIDRADVVGGGSRRRRRCGECGQQQRDTPLRAHCVGADRLAARRPEGSIRERREARGGNHVAHRRVPAWRSRPWFGRRLIDPVSLG